MRETVVISPRRLPSTAKEYRRRLGPWCISSAGRRSTCLLMSKQVLRLPALEIHQGPKRRLYSFAVDGKRLGEITTVSRIHREQRRLAGYQRPEVLAHVKAIRRYLESPGALMPNALVVAFDTRVDFKAASRIDGDESARVGHLLIPLVGEEGEKPGWLVDGQQRSA